jgi:hypothetical protein
MFHTPAHKQTNPAALPAQIVNGVLPAGLTPTITPWRVERNHKMHFRVARTGPDGFEVLRSPSGRESSFKTSAGARRARDWANCAEMEREDSACQICGEDGGTRCGAVNCAY